MGHFSLTVSESPLHFIISLKSDIRRVPLQWRYPPKNMQLDVAVVRRNDMTNSELQKSREILASLTVDSLQTSEGQEEFNQAAGEYIRDKIRKTSLFYRVIPPRSVTENELKQRGNTTGDQPDLRCLMPSVQKPGMAMLMDMRGEPVPEYVDGKQRLLIPMRTVKTKWFEKTTEELLASGILKVVEEIASWEAKERDRKFLEYCGRAVAQSKQILPANGPRPLKRSDLVDIKRLAVKNQIGSRVVLLLSEMAFGTLEDFAGSSDMTYIPSTKKELFDTWDNGKPASTIWSFPAPEFLGYNLYCGNYKVQSQRKADGWRFIGWEMVGAGIGNINGITKLTITSSRRLGFMDGEIEVPDDFDSMGDSEIEKMFEEDE